VVLEIFAFQLPRKLATMDIGLNNDDLGKIKIKNKDKD